MEELEVKIVLVTGANSGIGLTSAKRFVTEVAYVYITGRRDAELARTTQVVGLAEVRAAVGRMFEGKVRSRTVVDANA